MSVFNDISCGTKDNEKECLGNAQVISLYAKKFGIGQWSFIGPGSEKKWYSISEDSPQGVWDNMAEKMLVEFAESDCPIFRATSPLSRGRLQSKGHGKLSIHYAADLETVETTVSHICFCKSAQSLRRQSQKYVKSMNPFTIDQRQSNVLSDIKTEVPLENDDPAYQNFLLPQYEERIDRLLQPDTVSKFWKDAGFLSVVEIGQYFMTKDTGEQFYAVACREHTLPRDDWIITTKRMDPGKHKNWTRAGSHDQLLAWKTWSWD